MVFEDMKGLAREGVEIGKKALAQSANESALVLDRLDTIIRLLGEIRDRLPVQTTITWTPSTGTGTTIWPLIDNTSATAPTSNYTIRNP